MYFALPPIRSFWADNLEGGAKNQIITIAQNSGRAQVSEFTLKAADELSGAFRQGQFQLLPLYKSDKARRGVLWADVNGDGLPDLLVAEPESAADHDLSPKSRRLARSTRPKNFPTLTGVSELAVADWNGDGHPQIFALSGDERQIGVTRLDEKGRLPFPTLTSPWPASPSPWRSAHSSPRRSQPLAVIVDQDGKRSLVTRTADGHSKVQMLSENFKIQSHSGSRFDDVNQDGLADLVILIPYEKIKVLLQVPGKDFDEQDIAPPGGTVEEPWLSSADVDGDGKPELLLAQKNFLRAVVLKQEASAPKSTKPRRLGVQRQVSRSTERAAIPGWLWRRRPPQFCTNAVNSIFLLDAERKVLTLCERDAAGVWQVVRNIALPYTAFNSLEPRRPWAAPSPTVFAFGQGCDGLDGALQGKVWEFTELDGYETPIKDGHLNDVVTGDLDNDGRKDLVFLETAKNYLDLVIVDANRKLVPANRWPVFEERTFRSRRSDLPEPREAIVTDVTGDGKNDLIILVHDRILVYPQE